jgi:hypothetical protein
MIASHRFAKFAAVALVAGLGFAAAPVAAATCSTANLTTSTACQAGIPGGSGGNVTPAEMNAFNGGNGVFDVSDWKDFGKIDTVNAGGTFASQYFSVTSNSGNSSGTWKLNDGLKFAPGASYAFVLKGGTSNVAYMLDTAFTSGTWTNLDLFNPANRNAGMSNMTLMGTAAPIPLPAAAWLLLGGIAGLGAVARKRKAATA